MSVKLISITQGTEQQAMDLGLNKPMSAQELIAYTARVSNPANQINNETAPRLIEYLIKHKHWSPFEMASMTVEIVTSRAIAQQILRHRSFSFQEFSQRYAEAQENIIYPARRQDTKNRQNSIDDMSASDKSWFEEAQVEIWNMSLRKYKEAIMKGVAKEQARFLLPLSTMTKIYMCGSIRSWIHYLDLRSAHGTQKEHQDIALGIKAIFCKELPDVAKAMGWVNENSNR